MSNRAKYFSISGFPIISLFLLLFLIIMLITIDINERNIIFYNTIKWLLLFIIIEHIYIFKNILWENITKIILLLKQSILMLLKLIWENRSLTSMIVFSAGWLSFIYFMINSLHTNDHLDTFLDINTSSKGLKLNEWGDFFAGFMAPLALGWLAYSIYYQKKEFENVHSSLKEQVLELEMEKHYSSYEQQINKIDTLITNINSLMSTMSLKELNEKFTLSDPTNYIKVAINVKKVFLLDKNIHNLFKKHNFKIKSINALKVLEEQYNIIYMEDIEIVYQMLLKYYFLITISNETVKHTKPYQDFYTFDNWLTEDKKVKILDIINGIEDETLFSKKIDPAFEKIKDHYTDYLFLLEQRQDNESI